MREYITYQLEYYIQYQKDLRARINDPATEPVLKQKLREEANFIACRVVSARRNMRQKQDIIDSGVLGPMPEVFGNGRATYHCKKCGRRQDTVGMLAIKGDRWVWLNKCQQCCFEEKSKETIAAKNAMQEKVNETFGIQTEKQCAGCGDILSLSQFPIRGHTMLNGVTSPRYHYLCKACRNANSKNIDKTNGGRRKPMPYLFYKHKILLNKDYFIKHEDRYDASKVAEISSIVQDLNMSPEILEILKLNVKKV